MILNKVSYFQAYNIPKILEICYQNFWEEMYLRWVIDQSEREQAWRKIAQLRDKDKELRMRATRLRRQLADLEREAIQAGLLSAPSRYRLSWLLFKHWKHFLEDLFMQFLIKYFNNKLKTKNVI